jgi:site-specific recombinase XerC
MQETGLSKKTANYYLKAFQHFCRWMVEDRRAMTSPVAHLRAVQVDKQDLRRQRRPLEPVEVRRLLEATQAAEPRFGLTGHQKGL